MNNQTADWRDRRVVLLKDSADTRKGSRRAYQTISLSEIFEAADKPTSQEKSSARAIIPSSYASPDARTFAVQRKKGLFPMLAADIDTGNVALEYLEAAVDAAFGADVAVVIYSTSSATTDNNKWRVIAPLAEPVPFESWQRAQRAFFALLRQHEIIPDMALERAGQVIYLPNVPPGKRRGMTGPH